MDPGIIPRATSVEANDIERQINSRISLKFTERFSFFRTVFERSFFFQKALRRKTDSIVRRRVPKKF